MKKDSSVEPQKEVMELPEELHNTLRNFRNKLWRAKVTEAIFAGLLGLGISFLLLFVMDRFFATPIFVRLGVLIVGSSLFGVFVPYWIHRWVFKHRDESQLARLIAKSFPGFGDRLLGAIELEKQVEDAQSLSPRLRQAALLEVAEEVKTHHKKLAEAQPVSNRAKLGGGLFLTLGIIVAALFVVPQASWNALQRWIFPLKEIPRYTFTQIEAYEARKIVPLGESFSIDLRIAEESESRPSAGRARYKKQPWFETTGEKDGEFTFTFSPQKAEGLAQIEIGDAAAEIQVVPLLRPQIESLEAILELPEYLQLKPRRVSLSSGRLVSIEGTEVKLIGHTSRALSQADICWEGESKNLPVEIEGKTFSVPIDVDSAKPKQIQIALKDEFGLALSSSEKVRIESREDVAPKVYTQGLKRQVILLAEETLEFDLLCEDEYGLKAWGLEWKGRLLEASAHSAAEGELLIGSGAPDMTRQKQKTSFCPELLEIPPQELSLRAWAEDYQKERERSYSKPISLHILTKEEHAQLLKNRFERLMGELEESSREELFSMDENQRLEALPFEELKEEKTRARIAKQLQNEQKNRLKMEKLAEEMEDLVKEAVRNGEIGTETMERLVMAQTGLKELAEDYLPKIEENIANAASSRLSGKESNSEIKEAIEEQELAIGKMQEILKNAEETKQELEVATFVNRLSAAARQLDVIAKKLFSELDVAGGLRIRDVDPKNKRILKGLIEKHKKVGEDLRWLEDDLLYYHSRTKKEKHKKLLDTIKEHEIAFALNVNEQRMEGNRGFVAGEHCRYWSREIRKLADELSPRKSGGGGGGGGSGGGGHSKNKDFSKAEFEFMLRIMKLIQTEQDLRARTRALDQLLQTNKSKVKDEKD